MSSQRGNVQRSRGQKFQNKKAFKNDLHDSSHQVKAMNSMEIQDVCGRCKEVLEWKIKYKKYKPISAPRKCVKCEQKAVKFSYHTICGPCSKGLGICGKCGKAEESIVRVVSEKEKLQRDAEIQRYAKLLPERRRRTFMRYLDKCEKGLLEEEDPAASMDNIRKKFEELKAASQKGNDSDDFDFSNDDSSEDEEA